ncbi:MAG: hypothetical protein ACRESO_03105 [Gammaproteobacteria bacterium]
MKKIALILMMLASTAAATDLSNYIGYTIAAQKTIVGYVDQNGRRGDSFEGCKYGRKIIFDDNTYLTCTEYDYAYAYAYAYAYRPDAILLVRNGSWVMIVDDEAYDMQN